MIARAVADFRNDISLSLQPLCTMHPYTDGNEGDLPAAVVHCEYEFDKGGIMAP